MAAFEVNFEGQGGFDFLTPEKVRRAASRAINKVARDARSTAARAITKEVNLPASYVSPSGGRLAITEKATPSQLSSTITAQRRNTSLARFVSSGRRIGRAGVAVNVKPQSSDLLSRAFLIPLPRGFGGNTDGPPNIGLAIRLRRGERLSSTYAAKPLGNRGLYLLYGPSVAQVLENNAGSGVAKDIGPEIAERLEAEYLRLLELEARLA